MLLVEMKEKSIQINQTNKQYNQKMIRGCLKEEKEPAMWRSVTRVCLCVCVSFSVFRVSLYTRLSMHGCVLHASAASLWMHAYMSMYVCIFTCVCIHT